MTTLIQAAQQALDALLALHADGARAGWHLHPKWEAQMRAASDSINALRTALQSAQASEPELVQWHKEQAHGWRHAAMTSAADKVEPCRSSLLRMADFHESAAQAIASLSAPQQATPEPVRDDVVRDAIAAVRE